MHEKMQPICNSAPTTIVLVELARPAKGSLVEHVVLQIQQEPIVPWAVAREAEGWDGLGVGDHWCLEGVDAIAHPFVALGVLAAATSRARLCTTFANNLARSPVEFAQAALTTHAASGGRFEAGLGAGWHSGEIVGAGLDYPSPRARARRFREAIIIVRDLFRGGCSFHGEHYDVELPRIGPVSATPPRLSAALGGPWTLRNIGPLVDTIELAPMGAPFRSGTGDFGAYAQTTMDGLREMADLAREANSDAHLGLSLFAAAGNGAEIDFLADMFRAGCFDGLAGEPARVADTLRRFAELGIDHITIAPLTLTTPAGLAPHLLR
jgi:alkanesulfonate monooxygenase SsuD/methylene tetrahydromethanopterin reductase-like flavin-dependent oxidoreductase (luciferase family)